MENTALLKCNKQQSGNTEDQPSCRVPLEGVNMAEEKNRYYILIIGRIDGEQHKAELTSLLCAVSISKKKKMTFYHFFLFSLCHPIVGVQVRQMIMARNGEFGEQSSNPIRVCYIQSRSNTIGRIMNSSLLPICGLKSRTCIWKIIFIFKIMLMHTREKGIIHIIQNSFGFK